MKTRRQALYYLRQLPRRMRGFYSNRSRSEQEWRAIRNAAQRKLLRLAQAEKTRDTREIARGLVTGALPAVRLRPVQCRAGRPLDIGFTQQSQAWEGQEIPAGTRVHVRRAERGLRWQLSQRADGKFVLDIYPAARRAQEALPDLPEALVSADCYDWLLTDDPDEGMPTLSIPRRVILDVDEGRI